MPKPKPTIDSITSRFLSKIAIVGDCWVWCGGKYPNGYGRFAWSHNSVLAHIASYTLLVGEIPPGMEIDHTCKNVICVSPDHLEPVTSQENVRRSDSPCGRNARKTHCHRGHEFTNDNTYWIRGRRRDCLACRRLRKEMRHR